MSPRTIRLDENDIMFFKRELESIKRKAYEKKFPRLKAAMGDLFPISTEADPADERITYRMFEPVGVAKIIANYADDLPISDVRASETTSNIRGVGSAYKYNWQEIQKSRKTGRNLQQRKANSAKKSVMEKTERIAWYGDAEYGLVGFLNHPNITAGEIGVGPTSGEKEFSKKTPSEILDDLNNIIIEVSDLTNGVEVPDTLILPVAQFGIIASKRIGDGTDTTILRHFLDNNINQGNMRVDWVPQLKNVNPLPSGDVGTKDIMAAYVRDPDYISLEIPLPWEQDTPEKKNYSYKVNTQQRVGGVIIPYPLAVNIKEGI
jgi:hypothetical protein